MTFPVNSPSQPSGVITQTTGTLVITATVNLPLASGITSAANTATLVSSQTGIITDTTTTAILRPNVSISKSASQTLLAPGDVVTFTLTALNSGTATAANVTISDTLPSTAYFSYVANSARLNGTTIAPAPLSGSLLSTNIGSLAAGATANVTFQMQVAASGAPSGVTTLVNTAAITDTQTTGVRNSETVTVSISTNPNLRVAKSVTPSGTLAPGNLVTYTITISNTGGGDATGVLAQDPVPANTAYVASTLVYSNTAQTDILDSDVGSFDAGNNQIIFNVGTFAAGAQRTMKFTVRVNSPLPSGTTPFTNTVTASASNAASKQSTVASSASAAPVLTVDKTGPIVVPLPTATLTANVSAATTLQVDTRAQLQVGLYIRVAGQTRLITGINGTQVTVDSAVTASSGATLTLGIRYSIAYNNTGNANATGVVLTDTLPGGTTFITATNGGAPGGGNVVWNLGTLAPGDSGVVQVHIMPSATGSLVNTATMTSNQTAPVNDSLTTNVGGLRLTKLTTTPLVTQGINGANATYVLQLENTLGAAANGILITDTLASGFTYSSTVGITGYTSNTPVINPTYGDAQPAWGTFSIAGNGTLFITYTARISPTVGPATYQNFVDVTSTNQPTVGFDALATTAEDVRLQLATFTLNKTVTPSTVGAGQLVTYTIAANNSGDTVATGTYITDTLPAGFAFNAESSITTSGSVTRTSTVAPVSGATTPAWGGWDVAPSGTITITFSATTTVATGTFSNTVSVAGDNAPIYTLSNTAPVTTTPAANLVVGKSASPDPVLIGQPLTYTVVVTNTGPSTATGVALTDTLPVSVTLASASATQGTCSGTNPITCAIGSMTSGASVTATIVVTPTTAGMLTNTATATANENDPDPSNNTATRDVTVTPSADLAVVKTGAPNPVSAAGTLTYTLAITNAGPSTAANVVVTDTLPTGSTFITATSSSWVCGNGSGQVTCTTASLAASATSVITLTVTAPSAGGTITNTATITSTTGDPNLSNNQTSISTTVTALANLAIVKTDAPDPVNAASTLTYTLAITNTGPSDSTNVIVTDTLPAGTTFITATGSSWVCSSSGGLVTCTRATFAASATSAITLTVTTPAAGGLITNTATITSTTGDPNPLDNDAQAETTVTPVANLAITKTHSGSFVVGQAGTYTITVTNNGPSTAAATIRVTDTLPIGLGYVSSGGSGWTCSPAVQVVSCDNASGLASTASSTLTLTVSVDATAFPSVTNPVTVTSPTSDPDPSNNSATDPTTMVQIADLAISKSDGQTTAIPGTPITYTVVITNSGPSPVTSAVVSDTLPATLTAPTWVCVPSGGSSCGSASGSGNISTTVNLLNRGVATYTITATVSASATGALTNTATITVPVGVTDPDLNNNSATDVDTFVPSADLAIAKTHSGNFVVGQNGTYTITITNNGPSTAAATITVTDTLPAGLSFVSGTGTDWSCAAIGQTTTCTNASPLAVSATTTITLNVGVSSSAIPGITNTVTVASPTNDPVPGNNTATDPTTVIRSADLALAKTHSGDFSVGVDGTYTLTVTNNGPSTAVAPIVVTDTLPVGLTYISGGGTGWSCAAVGQNVTCTRAADLTFGSNSSFTLTVAVSSGAIPAVTNNAGLSSTTSDPNPSNNLASDPTIVGANADLALTKSHSGSFTVGSNGTYTLTVTNNGPSTALGNIVVTDTLPSGLSFVSASGIGWSCSAVGQNVTCNHTNDLSLGESATFTLTVGVAITAVPSVTNTATVASPTPDPSPSNNTATDPTTAQPVADLAISKTNGQSSLTPGLAVTYTLTVTNTGPNGVTGAIVNDTFPAALTGATWDCTAAGGGVCGALSGSGNISTTVDLPLNATATYTITATVASSATGTLTNTATITVPVGAVDPVPGNNSASDADPLAPSANLAISKIGLPNPVNAASTLTYTLTVTNAGPSDAANVTVTDTLPVGASFVSVTGTNWSFITSSGIVTGTRAALAANTTSAITLVVTAPAAGGVITNTAGITSTTSDPFPANNSTSTTNTIAPVADLAISKTDGLISIAPGQPLTYTIVVTNAGPSAVSGATVTDTFPAALIGVTWTCAASAGSSCGTASGSGNINTTANLLANGVITFTVPATVSLSASVPITNTATVAPPGSVTDPNLGNNSSTDTTTLTGLSADLRITKSDGGTFPSPGDVLTYTLTFTNTGSIDATNVTITETVPANTRYTGAGWTCAPSIYAGSSCTRVIPTIAGGNGLGSAQFSVTITNPLPAGSRQISNTVRIDTDATPNDNTHTITTTVNAAPVLNIVKTDGGATTAPGGTVMYTIMYSNTGNIDATGVTITDTVPANTTFNPGASAPGWSCAPNNNAGSLCALSIGAIPVGSGASVLFTINVASPLSAGANPITNTAYISDDSGNRNSSSDTTPIIGAAPDLAITKTDGGITATPGNLITYTLRYTNTGNIGASNVLISETVPAYTTFAGPLATWSCNVGDGAGTWCLRNVGVVASGGSGTVQYSVRVTTSVPIAISAITNTVRVSDDGANGQDVTPNNNVYTRTTPLSAAAALTITKTANVSSVNPGGTITYTLRYTNTGTVDATGVVLTDTVPVSTTFTGTGWTCTPNNNAGSSCTRSVGTLAVGGSGSAQFVVMVANPLPPGITQIVNTALIGDDASHAATSTSTIPTSAPPSTLRFFLPFIARAGTPPTPTPTRTRTPTPYQWPIIDPKGMVSDPTRDRLWLASHYDDSVVVFTESTITSTNPTLLAKITVGQKPFGIGLVDNKVYVANTGVPQPASVSVINAATMTVIKTISLSSCGGEATHLAVNPNTHRVYTTLHASGKVAVIDTTSDSLVACVTTNAGAFGIAAHPVSNSIFVGNRDGLDLWRIDGATNIATQVKNWSNGSGGGSPFYVGTNPATNLLFAMVGLPSSDRPNKLYVYSIDGSGNLSNERIASVGNTDDGGFVVQSQCSSMIYIAETADNQVRILTSDLSSYGVVTEASGLVGHGPFGLLENPTLKRVYVSNKPANTLSVLSECPGPLARAMQAMTPLPSATPTTASKMATLTRTLTVTVTLTKTPVPAIAPTVTATPTKTPTPKLAPTITSSPTNTPARTATPTSTATLAATPTVRATSTLTATSSITTTK